MPSNHLILCHPLLLLPSVFPSIRVFSNESALHIRWPKYWSFSFSISPSNEYSGLISFRMDWLDLLAIQEILKSLLQHHSSKTSILQCSAFFIVQLSHMMRWLWLIQECPKPWEGALSFHCVRVLSEALCWTCVCLPAQHPFLLIQVRGSWSSFEDSVFYFHDFKCIQHHPCGNMVWGRQIRGSLTLKHQAECLKARNWLRLVSHEGWALRRLPISSCSLASPPHPQEYVFSCLSIFWNAMFFYVMLLCFRWPESTPVTCKDRVPTDNCWYWASGGGSKNELRGEVGFPGGSVVKNPPANAGDTSSSLAWEDPLEMERATHSSILVWRIRWKEEPRELWSSGSQRVRCDLATKQ